MKNKLFTLIAIFLLQLHLTAQEKPKALILNFQTENLFATPTLAANIVRIELDKMKKFSIYEKNDITDIATDNNIKLEECYNATCILNMGKSSSMDKVFSGSMLMLGNKIVITIKMFNTKTETIEKTQLEEFINLESELQNMVHITLMKMFDQQPEKELLEKLSYFQNISELPTTKINNNGPRMGAAYIGGFLGDRYTAPEQFGGYGSSNFISQFGYQLEAQYLSAGNLQALAEVLFIVGGLDQQLFIPSLVLMNGFRLNNSGWEIAFGPSFGVTKTAYGFYTDPDLTAESWHLESELLAMGYEPWNHPFTIVKNVDKRGIPTLTSSWVWGFGKTFRSGYLNIPVNAYFSKTKGGWFAGISCGFNIRKKEQNMKVTN